MIIVLKQHAPADKVQAFCNELNSMGFQINDSVGSDTHILGLIGDTKALAESWVLANPVVETCRRVSEPYKKANRKFHPDDTIVDVGGHKIGGGYFAVMSGPCSVESKEQITYVAQRVQAAGASILRGGAFKPRTSPYSFQGLRAEGLELLQEARKVTGQPIVTELMNNEHIPLFVDAKVDMIQIGARNMQNFELLKAVGKLNVPVLLKRGLSSTLEELVMSAEYIMAEGNPNVVLCERGIRTFETSMRNTLDISAVPMLKKMTHLPVVIDPSHAAGIAFMVPALAQAAVAVGADGLMIETHNDPAKAKSDGAQSLTPDQFDALMNTIKPDEGPGYRDQPQTGCHGKLCPHQSPGGDSFPRWGSLPGRIPYLPGKACGCRTQPWVGSTRPLQRIPLSGTDSGHFLSLIQLFPLLVRSDFDIHGPRQEAPQRHAGGNHGVRHNDRFAAGHAVQRTAHAVFRRDAPQRKLHVRHSVELGVDRAGAEAADIHGAAGLAQLLRQCTRQADNVGLGGVVGRHVGACGHQPCAGADVQQCAETLLIELLPDFLRQDVQRPDVDRQHIEFRLQKRPAVAKARVVDEEIHAAALQRLDQAKALTLFGQIRSEDLADRRQLVGQLFQPVRAAGHQQQVISAGGKLARELGPDTRACTGDNCKFWHSCLLFCYKKVQKRLPRGGEAVADRRLMRGNLP